MRNCCVDKYCNSAGNVRALLTYGLKSSAGQRWNADMRHVNWPRSPQNSLLMAGWTEKRFCSSGGRVSGRRSWCARFNPRQLTGWGWLNKFMSLAKLSSKYSALVNYLNKVYWLGVNEAGMPE